MFFVENVRRDHSSWQPEPSVTWSLVLRFLVLGFVVGWLVGYSTGRWAV